MENYFHIINTAMKKCHYEGPLLKFVGGPGVPLLNFEGDPGVPLLNFEGGPGSRGPGPTFTPCLQLSFNVF